MKNIFNRQCCMNVNMMEKQQITWYTIYTGHIELKNGNLQRPK